MKFPCLLAILVSISIFCCAGNQKKAPQKDEVFKEYLNDVYIALLDPNFQKNRDPSISSEQILAKGKLIGLNVSFNEIPNEPPYRLEKRRLKQFNPDKYLSAPDEQLVLNTVRADGLKSHFGIFMPSKSYLPGERVFWRISSNTGEVLKQTVCTPRPLLLKNSDDKILMEAVLVSANRPTTVYLLCFPPREESFDLIFHCGKNKKTTIKAGRTDITLFEPKIEGQSGGISTIEIISKGKSYSINLPWGNKLESSLYNRWSFTSAIALTVPAKQTPPFLKSDKLAQRFLHSR